MKFAPLPRILCVDDNIQLLPALKLGLETYGFEVVTAFHGIDALMQYKAHKGCFDFLLTDNDMPHMNGVELVRSVREMGFKGRTVVMSGRLNLEDLKAYQNYDVSCFCHKPFETRQLALMLLQEH